MRLHLRRPSAAALAALADEQRSHALTYPQVGMTAHVAAPDGYRRNIWSRVIGSGRRDFEAARDALRSWEAQSGSGLAVAADSDVAPGIVVALSTPLPGAPFGWLDVACRVVDVVDRQDSWSFAYGTLPEHVAQGEERFGVTLAPDGGDVTCEICAVSRMRNPVARLVPPVANVLQGRAAAGYLDAIEAAVAASR